MILFPDVRQPCQAGYYSTTGLGPCTPCNLGTYQDGQGQKQCKLCPANQYQDHTGQKACTACPSGQDTGGKSGSTSKDSCVGMCPPGEVSPTGKSPGCTLCKKVLDFTLTKLEMCTVQSKAWYDEY